MSEIRDKVREKIACQLCGLNKACEEPRHKPILNNKPAGMVCEYNLEKADEILSIESLAIVDRDAKLPPMVNKWCSYLKQYLNANSVEKYTRSYMVKAGYVLEVKE